MTHTKEERANAIAKSMARVFNNDKLLNVSYIPDESKQILITDNNIISQSLNFSSICVSIFTTKKRTGWKNNGLEDVTRPVFHQMSSHNMESKYMAEKVYQLNVKF